MDEVRPGQRVISADALNDAISGGRSALGTRVQGGTEKHVPGVGTVIDATQRERRKDVNDDVFRKVVIKKSPSTLNAGWVTVQRVTYMDWPIQPCTSTGCRIEVAGAEFEARPDFGIQTDGYKADELAGAISTGTTFYDCRWDGREWVLDAPASGGSGISLCLVHNPFSGSTWGIEQFIRVVHMKEVGGVLVTAEDTTSQGALGYSIVKCWPGTQGQDWQYFKSTQGTAPNFTATSTAVYVATVKISGIEYVAPIFFSETGAPDSGTLAGDC